MAQLEYPPYYEEETPHRYESDVRSLVNAETAAARRQLQDQIDAWRNDAKGVVVASAGMALAFMALIVTVILLLALWMPAWGAAGIVTIALTALSLVLFAKLNKKRATLISAPGPTLDELRRELEGMHEGPR